MLLDIPANLELIVASQKGVRTLRRGDNLDDSELASGTVKIMGMRLVGASQTAISRSQTQQQHLQYGELMFNIGIALLCFQHFGASSLIVIGLVWIVATKITRNTNKELDSLISSAQSRAASHAHTADAQDPRSTD